MAVLTLSQTIDKPAPDVFDVIIRCGDFASWNPTIRASRQITVGDIGNGSRFEWELRGFGKVSQVLQEVERNRRIRIVPDSKMISGGHRFTLVSEGDRTRVEHELEMNAKGMFRLMSPIMRMFGGRNLRATAVALKAHIETDGCAR